MVNTSPGILGGMGGGVKENPFLQGWQEMRGKRKNAKRSFAEVRSQTEFGNEGINAKWSFAEVRSQTEFGNEGINAKRSFAEVRSQEFGNEGITGWRSQTEFGNEARSRVRETHRFAARWCISCTLLAGLLVFVGGCNRGDTDRLAKIGKILVGQGEQMIGGLRDDFSEEWKNIETQHREKLLSRRVKTRLSLDKRLADAKILVDSHDDTIVLRGQVNDVEQKRRAVNLAESTSGVEKVDDRLKLAN